eukprot:Skav206698  [mRNA]  locus=scaffold99:60115:66756:+ [translate_table: standard]
MGGQQVLTLLQKALQRRPRWRALQGGALCLRHFGPRAVKELLLVTAQRPPQRSWCAALRAHSDGDAAPAVLAVLEALRLLAAVDPEFLLLAFGNLADAHGSNFAPRGLVAPLAPEDLRTAGAAGGSTEADGRSAELAVKNGGDGWGTAR